MSSAVFTEPRTSARVSLEPADRPVTPPMTDRDRQRMLRAALRIKQQYADGEPLRGKDRRLVMALLKGHPKAADKIGCGVEAIVADQYVGGSRCFFVIRTDGTVEDFSIYKCVGREKTYAARVLAMMRRFNYRTVLRHFLRYREALSAGQAAVAAPPPRR